MQGMTKAKDGWLYQHFPRDIPKHRNDYEKFDIAESTNSDQKPGRAELTTTIESQEGQNRQMTIKKPGRAELTTTIESQEGRN